MRRLAGKTAVVTGAAGGIGEATARAFAMEGAAVMLTDVSPDVHEVAVAISGDCISMVQDVTVEAEWDRVMMAVQQRWGRLDILVNNAGISMFGTIDQLSYEQWRRCITVDLDSVFLGTRAALPIMRESGGGAIINISSMAGITGQRSLAAYCAAKGGVRFFTKAVALDCAAAGDGIRVNSVHPGIIDTPIFLAVAATDRRAPVGAKPIDVAEAAARSVPMKRPGRPQDVAAACVYLASDEAAYVTGTELIVDGGYCAA